MTSLETLPTHNPVNTLRLLPAAAVDFTARQVVDVDVDPVHAELWLSRRENSEVYDRASFNRLVTDIRNGDYEYFLDPIRFGEDGSLLDGAVRLHAILKTGQTLRFPVATGIPASSLDLIGTGRSVKLAEVLERHQVSNPAKVASALRAIQAWERGDYTNEPSGGATTNRTSLAFLEQNADVANIAVEAARLSARIPSLTTGNLSMLLWAFNAIDRDDSRAFFTAVDEGANLQVTDPIYQLRAILQANETAVEKRTSRSLLALTIKTWNAWRGAVQMKTLKFRAGGANPEDFPLPR